MKNLIRKILKENLTKREIDSILSLIEKKDIKKHDIDSVKDLLGRFDYSDNEIWEIYLAYLNNSYNNFDDLVTLTNYLTSLYGNIIDEYDENHDAYNFYSELPGKESKLIFYTYINFHGRYGREKEEVFLVIPSYLFWKLKSILKKEPLDLYNLFKEYMYHNFGIRVNDVSNSVAVG